MAKLALHAWRRIELIAKFSDFKNRGEFQSPQLAAVPRLTATPSRAFSMYAPRTAVLCGACFAPIPFLHFRNSEMIDQELEELIGRAISDLRVSHHPRWPEIRSLITEGITLAALPVIFRSCMSKRSFDTADVLADAPELCPAIDAPFVDQVLRDGIDGRDGLGLFEDEGRFVACFENLLIAEDAAEKTGDRDAILRYLNLTEQDTCRCLLSLPALTPDGAQRQKNLASELIF